MNFKQTNDSAEKLRVRESTRNPLTTRAHLRAFYDTQAFGLSLVVYVLNCFYF